MAEQEELDINEEVEDDSLSAALSAAWDDAEEVDEVPAQEIADEPETTEPQQTETAEAAPDTDTTADSTGELQEKGETEPETTSAPLSLTPAGREAWKDTPDAIRKEMVKRENDFAVGMQKHAENANRATQMDGVLRPFESLFQMDGGKPAATITGLLQTASALQMGAPMQKAQTVATIIKNFGVDIEALDGILSGQDVPRGTQQGGMPTPQDIQQLVNQQVQQTLQHNNQQVQGQQVQGEIQTFASDPDHEFYQDVKGDMADILDVHARQGKNLSLKQAYEKACMMRDDISNIIRSRQSAPTAAQRRASKSIRGVPSGNQPAPEANSLRDALESAWESAGVGD